MNVASKRQDVRSVVAISPFVGWDIVGAWEQKHMDNPTWASYLKNAINVYGPFNPESPAYYKQSIQYAKVEAPTLLIQGTDDQQVPWGIVQIFYEKMRANHQNATFKLIDGVIIYPINQAPYAVYWRNGMLSIGTDNGKRSMSVHSYDKTCPDSLNS